ncbi:hypothetical protein MXM41_09620 [Leclercia adecarboxylata]|uniref:hypothetical protein n=1 Tax=Leclercia adecarboxylata TaxID=83655 RepID=UPI002DBE5387|nr:hypothetical protein [Leclercia adecarboxylata]MEB6379189.1 hypothetical protein [Leclercia adecarboxylata]
MAAGSDVRSLEEGEKERPEHRRVAASPYPAYERPVGHPVNKRPASVGPRQRSAAGQ